MKPLDCDNDLFQFQTHYIISKSAKLVIKCYAILNARDKKSPGRLESILAILLGRDYNRLPLLPTPEA
jgi:hypothetical protein